LVFSSVFTFIDARQPMPIAAVRDRYEAATCAKDRNKRDPFKMERYPDLGRRRPLWSLATTALPAKNFAGELNRDQGA